MAKETLAKSAPTTPAFRPRPGKTDEEQDAIRRGEALVAEAWREKTRRGRAEKAREALKAWPDCADAWVLLGETSIRSPREAVETFEKGVAAGERALGPDALATPGKAFTDRPDALAWMKAKVGLAKAYWAVEEREKALEQLQAVYRLAPDDALRVRHLIGTCLFILKRLDEAEAFFASDRFREDRYAAALYPRALLAFRKSGDADASQKLLDAAAKANPHLVPYILEEKAAPPVYDDDFEPGTEAEADYYASDAVDVWKTIPGALDWLAERTGRHLGPPEPIHASSKVGRNDPCPCGSGKKFKKCCG
jgi:tetratricopeptide (TPR) repeat protein